MSSNQSLQPKNLAQFKLPPQIQKYGFSQEMFCALQKLLKYDHDFIINLSNNELKDLCQREIRRLQNTKSNDKIEINILLDNQVSIMVMMNQIRALVDLSAANDENTKKLAMARKRRSSDLQQSRESVMVRRYEGIASQIQKYQDEINKFMEAQVINKDINFVSCYSFFRRINKKIRKNNSEKLICSYAYLLNAATYLLGQVLKKYSPQVQPQHDDDQIQIEEQGNGGQFGDLSYEQINKWKRMASRVIEQKLVQLAAICEQIPQLQTFNRNLQFSQLENRQKIIILKIVDVIISLHHRVSYLSRNKPQLLRQLEYVQQQIQIFNNTCSIFLQHLEMHSSHLRPIKFEGEVRKNNNLSEGFLLMRKNLMKMSEIIVNGQQYHNSNLKRMIEFILLFVKAFTGHGEYSQQWQGLVQQISNSTQSQYSQEQYEVIMQLQECMIEHHNKLVYMQQMDQQSNTKTNEELEEEVNKLISDFQRLKNENKQHVQNLDLLTKLRQELEMEIEERDNMIYNLSAIKVNLQKKILNQEGASHHSSRAVQEQLKKQQHQTQKYLQSSLLLRQQLKVSENEREKLLELLERQKQKNIKLFESANKSKAEKERLELQNEQLSQRIQKNKNDHLRQSNKLNKQINDITNQRDLLEMELKTAEANNAKLMQRLQLNQKKLLEYSKLALHQEKQHKYQRQSKSQAEIQRLEGEMDRYRRQVERLRKDVENRRVEVEMVQIENSNYKQENYVLKNKMKEIRASQEEIQEKDETIKELKAKLDKSNAKINALTKENEEIRQEEEQASNKYKYSAKRVKQLQAKLIQLQVNNGQFIIDLQLKNNQNIDLQKQLASQNNQYSTQIKFYKDLSSKQGQDLKNKDDRIQNLERKIEKLQQQLSQKQQRNEESSKELVQMKMKQFESTIQTHKLIQIKLEEQARTLKTQLQQKIEVEIKLNFEIQKLSKEIQKLKDLLERYMRDITEKEFIIKKEREKYEQQVKIIRDYQIKEKVYQENQTPIRNDGKRSREEDTIDDRQNSNNKKRSSQQHQNNLDNSLSRSNVKYDMFYNAKEYERLLKEYTDYKGVMTVRLQELQRSLGEARKNKIDLEIKFNNSQLQIKKILNSKVINNNGYPHTAGGMNSNQTISEANNTAQLLDAKKKMEAQLIQYNSIVIQYQVKVKDLSELIGALQQKVKKLQEENSLLYDRIKKQKEISELKISQLQNIISTLSKPSQQAQSKITQEIDSLRKEKKKLAQELAQTINTITNQREANNSKDIQQFKRTIQSLNDQINKILQQRSRQQASRLQLIKERDLIRKQYEDMRIHLSEQAKKASNLMGQIQKYKEELRVKETFVENNNSKKIIAQYESQIQAYRQELRIQKERNKHEISNVNIQFYLEKIKALQLALAAVGEELTDAKQALSKQRNQSLTKSTNNRELQIMLQDNKKLFNENQYFNQVILQLKMQIQNCIRNESQWKSRQAIYLKDLQILSRQNIYFRDNMGKSEKQITTQLPNTINPINTNYHDPDQSDSLHSADAIIRQMDVVIEGKMRWQGTRLIESLQRWRVPIIIHKEIEDLLNFLTQAVELIKSIRSQYISLRNLAPNNPLFANLLELVFRILAYFSEIETNSTQAKKIKSQIDQIAKKYSGGVFFTVLEEFTIHILQNNAIEEYKRELKQKAKELLQIKEKLDELITRQIEQEEKILSKPLTHRSRDTTPYRQSHSASPKQ